MTRNIILLLITALVLTNCKTSPPDRVSGIPENAFWVGGKDGGQWYVLDSIDRLSKTLRCKIYNDFTGELQVDKKFKLHCYLNETKINWDNLQDEFNAYDGEYLLLKTKDADGKSCWFK